MKGLLCAIIGLAMSAQGLLAQDGSLDAARRLADQGRHGDALQAVDRALLGNPGSAEALFLRGVVLARAGRVEEAKEVFLDLTQRYPESPEPFNNLAVLFAQGGDYERSVKVLKRALQTHSSYGTAYDNLTKVYGKLASRAYDRALGQESSSPSAGPALELLADLDAEAGASVGASVTLAAREDPLAASEPVRPSEPVARPEPRIEVAEPIAQVAPAEPIVEFDAAGVVAMVKAWASAWSDQRADDYVDFYSQSFAPEGGGSRRAWAAQRRDRIRRPRFIQVAVDSIGVRQSGDQRAQARFNQSYRSDRFADRVSKTFDLVWEAGGWKIHREVAQPN